MKKPGFDRLWLTGVLICLFSSPVFADDAPAEAVPGESPVKAEEMVSRAELDRLKNEWEAVREQQIEMIREKEDQLEKLKEEIFTKMKEANAPVASQEAPAEGAASGAGTDIEAQKAVLRDERQKFFAEMNRQKESLRQQQIALDEKTQRLEAERERFEQEKKAAVR